MSRLLLATFGCAAAATLFAAEIDLAEFDTLLMQDLDATVKELEPLIGGRDVAAASEAVVFLRDGLAWTEDYFATREVADGAAFARDGKDQAAAVLRALEAGDFTAATEGARAVAKSCRTCHDVYRP